VAVSYLRLATIEGERTHPDWNKAMEYIEKGESFKPTITQPSTYIKILLTKTEAYINQKKYSLAIENGLEILSFIDNHTQNDDSDLTDRYDKVKGGVYTALALSYDGLGDYKKAYEYKSLQSDIIQKISEKARYRTIKDMEVKYDTKAKEREIQVLHEYNLFHQKIRYLYAGIIILLIVVIIIGVRLHRMKRKATLRDMEMIQMEKDEIGLQMKLKEEYTKRVELEKYEALLDIHFKEREIEQVKLDNDELKRYELKHFNHKKNLTQPLIDEITLLINKKEKIDKNGYIEQLALVDDKFITGLENISNNSISLMYIKYCICFAIGLDACQVSEYFSLELNSVHMIRYRLKKKLRLDNNDKLDIYLINLLRNN